MSTDALPALDSALLLEQQIRYSYDAPIKHLRHRLIVIPRAAHGAQLRSAFEVSVSEDSARVRILADTFSNCVAQIDVDRVASEIEFSAWALVTRRESPEAHEPLSTANDRRFRAPSALTKATTEIAEVARQLAATGAKPREIGEMACRWTSGAISYGYGATDVFSTAETALSAGTGVCQDYAHIMLALCRAAGVSARYVSGHLAGEGGSHAWVEVLDSTPEANGVIAVGLDPTHDRPVDGRYLTVAVGRDYSDVAPTSGTFHGRAHGELRVRKVVRQIEELADRRALEHRHDFDLLARGGEPTSRS